MKIRLNLSEAHFIKFLVKAILDGVIYKDAENEIEGDKLIAKDILNKFEK